MRLQEEVIRTSVRIANKNFSIDFKFNAFWFGLLLSFIFLFEKLNLIVIAFNLEW